MGKGDKKSKRGKITIGSYGVRRSRKKKRTTPHLVSVPREKEVKKAPVIVEAVVDEPVITVPEPVITIPEPVITVPEVVEPAPMEEMAVTLEKAEKPAHREPAKKAAKEKAPAKKTTKKVKPATEEPDQAKSVKPEEA